MLGFRFFLKRSYKVTLCITERSPRERGGSRAPGQDHSVTLAPNLAVSGPLFSVPRTTRSCYGDTRLPNCAGNAIGLHPELSGLVDQTSEARYTRLHMLVSLVDPRGLEPRTPALQKQCSAN